MTSPWGTSLVRAAILTRPAPRGVLIVDLQGHGESDCGSTSVRERVGEDAGTVR